MKHIRIVIFASLLHDSSSVMSSRKELFEGLKRHADIDIEYPSTLLSNNLSNPSHKSIYDGTPACDSLLPDDDHTVCFIATGGTEEIFKSYARYLPHPIYILSDGFHNSFAASFEIATYLDKLGIANRIFNAPMDNNDNFYDDMCRTLFEDAVNTPAQIEEDPLPKMSRNALHALSRSRIGLVGGESSWLIASGVDIDAVTRKWGATFCKIDINELIEGFNSIQDSDSTVIDTVKRYNAYLTADRSEEELVKAARIYAALKATVSKYNLNALTVKCFDILKPCNSTACLALALLNDEGIISGCEGDIPSLWSMLSVFLSRGRAPFMANPSSSNRKELTVDFAHCTIPTSMLHGFRLPSHFESSIGIAVKGSLPSGRYRILKFYGPSLDKVYRAEGDVIMNTNVAQRCRTQIRFRFDSGQEYDRFISHRAGNHCIIYPID